MTDHKLGRLLLSAMSADINEHIAEDTEPLALYFTADKATRAALHESDGIAKIDTAEYKIGEGLIGDEGGPS